MHAAHVPLASGRWDREKGFGLMIRGRGVRDNESAGETALAFSAKVEPFSCTCELGRRKGLAWGVAVSVRVSWPWGEAGAMSRIACGKAHAGMPTYCHCQKTPR
jgi:hypothetical protein